MNDWQFHGSSARHHHSMSCLVFSLSSSPRTVLHWPWSWMTLLSLLLLIVPLNFNKFVSYISGYYCSPIFPCIILFFWDRYFLQTVKTLLHCSNNVLDLAWIRGRQALALKWSDLGLSLEMAWSSLWPWTHNSLALSSNMLHSWSPPVKELWNYNQNAYFGLFFFNFVEKS